MFSDNEIQTNKSKTDKIIDANVFFCYIVDKRYLAVAEIVPASRKDGHT